MSSYQSPVAILVTCLLMLFADTARADIVKCTNSAGAVTFRDVPCKAGEDAVRLGSPINPAPVKEKLSAPAYAHTPIKIDKVPPDHGLGTDVATLKAAKEMQGSLDRLSKLPRQQTFARGD
jgi:hypothetical protein